MLKKAFGCRKVISVAGNNSGEAEINQIQSWNEIFHYLLDFDDSAEPKITNYQVWADSGAAYLASQGRLAEVREQVQTRSDGS
jgi:hypothetical protein